MCVRPRVYVHSSGSSCVCVICFPKSSLRSTSTLHQTRFPSQGAQIVSFKFDFVVFHLFAKWSSPRRGSLDNFAPVGQLQSTLQDFGKCTSRERRNLKKVFFLAIAFTQIQQLNEISTFKIALFFDRHSEKKEEVSMCPPPSTPPQSARPFQI